MPNKRTTFDRGLIVGLSDTVQKTIAARENTAESRSKSWCERLGTKWSNRHNALSLEAAVSVMNADRANLQFAHGERLILKSHRGFSQAFLDYFKVVVDEKTCCLAAWKTRRAIHVQDVTTSQHFSQPAIEVLLKDGIRAVSSAPLLTDAGRMIGVLSVHYCQPYAMYEKDLARFRRLATYIAELLDQRSSRTRSE
ncbi:MAG: GAF domain-containing protein [Nitrospira sp.]